MALCIGPGQPGPTSHRAVPCLCRVKIPGFVPCQRARGFMAIYSPVLTRTLIYVVILFFPNSLTLHMERWQRQYVEMCASCRPR